MITARELDYVSGWARKVPYPGLDYAKAAAEKLINAVDIYKKYYEGKEHDIILSNGEQIIFEILKQNLCHMLGIDRKNLTSEYFDVYREDVLKLTSMPNTYELLTSIVENIDEVLKSDNDKGTRALNYYRIMVKCSIFEKLSSFADFNFGIINFDNERYAKTNGKPYSGNSQRFLYFDTKESVVPISLMGILKDTSQEESKTREKYVVETLMAPVNVKPFFEGQDIAIPTQILITNEDEMQKYTATPQQKQALLDQYRLIVQEYGIPNRMDIYGDYQAILAEQSKTMTRKRQP